MKKLFLFAAPFLLTACGQIPIFGIPQYQWDQLNEKQRNQVIEGYNRQKTIEAQTAPLNAAINALAEKNSQPQPAEPYHPHHYHPHNIVSNDDFRIPEEDFRIPTEDFQIPGE